jgi:TctA family transporter
MQAGRPTLGTIKQIWTGRVAQVAAKYGENAPTAAVCCNACRTCVQTNLIGLALGVIAAAGAAVSRCFARST